MTDALRRLRASVKDLAQRSIYAATEIQKRIRLEGASRQDGEHVATIRRNLEFIEEQIEAGKQLGGSWSDASLDRRAVLLKELVRELEEAVAAARLKE